MAKKQFQVQYYSNASWIDIKDCIFDKEYLAEHEAEKCTIRFGYTRVKVVFVD